MDPGVWFAFQAGVGAALFLASAKTHGRQVRLEREFLGFREVGFRSDHNPPQVEAIWRRDRVRFWWRYGALAAGLIAYAAVASPLGLARPPSLAGTGNAGTAGLVGIGLVFWLFPAVFVVNALESAWMLRSLVAARTGRPAGGPRDAGVRRAWAGTAGWLLASAALAAAVAILAGR